MYGQLVGSDFSSSVKVYVNLTAIEDPKAVLYPPIIKGTTSFDSKTGMVIV